MSTHSVILIASFIYGSLYFIGIHLSFLQIATSHNNLYNPSLTSLFIVNHGDALTTSFLNKAFQRNFLLLAYRNHPMILNHLTMKTQNLFDKQPNTSSHRSPGSTPSTLHLSAIPLHKYMILSKGFQRL
jgi:hypothetical protein